jgi:hypothetical protein
MSNDPTNFVIDHHTVNRQEHDRINRIHNINRAIIDTDMAELNYRNKS